MRFMNSQPDIEGIKAAACSGRLLAGGVVVCGRRTEDVLALIAQERRDSPVLPVLDALHSALFRVPKGTGQRGGAAELVDEVSVCMKVAHAR